MDYNYKSIDGTMNIINGWKNRNKQSDKYQCKLRLGRITVYDIFYDFGDGKGAITFMNFTIKLSKKKVDVPQSTE